MGPLLARANSSGERKCNSDAQRAHNTLRTLRAAVLTEMTHPVVVGIDE